MPLYVVATPIGNLKDITLRALETLQSVDLIACEDTRQTRKLLSHYHIHTPTVSLHQHNELRRLPALLERLDTGQSIALVSDAGTPLVSDPGAQLVRAAVERGCPVIPIPGASALTTALSAAGLAFESFFFAGFLPARHQARISRLETLKNIGAPLLFYESPHRIRASLQDMLAILGDRQVCIGRELTKMHEEFLRGSCVEVIGRIGRDRARGEYVVIVEPGEEDRARQQRAVPDAAALRAEVTRLQSEKDLELREAVGQVAASYGLSKNRLYRDFIKSQPPD